MKSWQTEAICKIENAAKAAKQQILNAPNNPYNRVRGEIDIWLIEEKTSSSSSVRLYQPF